MLLPNPNPDNDLCGSRDFIRSRRSTNLLADIQQIYLYLTLHFEIYFAMILFLGGFTEIIIMDITKISQWFPLPLCHESRPYPNPNPDTDLRGSHNIIYSLVFNKFTHWHSTNSPVSYTQL